ncbi:MAG: GGDEF domain-containing protein [Phycisphaerales bacterium]|nr:GGDEF domain-containing protein [Phycisphaerales bacterium]
MAGTPSVLIVGDEHLRNAVRRALPGAAAEHCPDLLTAVLLTGRLGASHVILSAEAPGDFVPAVAAMRRIAPAARIVAASPPRLEPLVRSARMHGIDDYVISPIGENELRHALQWTRDGNAALPDPAGAAAHPSGECESWDQLAEVLRRFGGSSVDLVEGWAQWLCSASGAAGAMIELDGRTARSGESGAVRIERPILRDADIAGRILIEFRPMNEAAQRAAERLADRLVGVILAGSAAHEDLAAWRRLALTDDLTGLHNRRYFERELDALLASAITRRQRATLLLFDIDDFKRYNDALGHDAGDSLLREIAMLLKRCSRREDIVCRFGGDEFAVVFRDAPEPRIVGSGHPTEAQALHDRFLRAIAEHDFQCLGPGAPATVTVSGGLAGFPWDGLTRVELLRAADSALLRAKAAGRNRILLAGPDLADPDPAG